MLTHGRAQRAPTMFVRYRHLHFTGRRKRRPLRIFVCVWDGCTECPPTVFLRYPFTNITLARHPERQRSFTREPCEDLLKAQTIEASRVKPLLAEGSILEPL